MIEPLDSSWKRAYVRHLSFMLTGRRGRLLRRKITAWFGIIVNGPRVVNRAIELKDELTSRFPTVNLEILEGNKVVEIKNMGINKGRAAKKILQEYTSDKIIAR